MPGKGEKTMLDTHNLNMMSYSPVGDIIVMALCFIMAILMLQTYISNNRKILVR